MTIRRPRIGERIHVIGGPNGNIYRAQNGDFISGMEGPYADGALWDDPHTGWVTFDPNAAHRARYPKRITIDASELQRGDIIVGTTAVAADSDGRVIYSIDVDRPPKSWITS